MKKLLLALLIVLSAASLPADDFPYRLDWKKDAIIAGSAVALYGTHLAIQFTQDRDSAKDHGLDRLHKSDINFVDRAMMHRYSRSLDLTGDVLLACTMAAPFALAIHQTKDNIITGAVMYAEALLISHSVKELTKDFVVRWRPYCYYDDTRSRLLKDEDSGESFMSGHTATAFTSASFLSTVYAHMHPEGKGKYLVAGGSFAAAAAVGTLRILSGNHFFTDVLVGAAWGTLAGWLVPQLHYCQDGKPVKLSFISETGAPGILFNF
ncbi:MAG: phosphatase PAP2 family protein [Spirochaetales bacterium]|nr:phosphatase PAP2 family protein [Spirochaetales bacterium]